MFINKIYAENKMQHWEIVGFTHTLWRFVKLPMLGDRIPDRFWLGVPLQQKKNTIPLRKLFV